MLSFVHMLTGSAITMGAGKQRHHRTWENIRSPHDAVIVQTLADMAVSLSYMRLI